MLKHLLSSLDGLSDPEKQHYKERPDAKEGEPKYELDAEGLVPADRLKQFRENNVTLNRTLEEEKKKWEGLDAADVRTLMQKRKEIEEGEVIKKEGVEKVIEGRTKAMADEHAKVKKADEEKINLLTRELTLAKVDNAVTAEVTKLGALPDAVELITTQARAVWSLDEKGNAVARNPDGTQIFSKETGNPVKMEEWAKDLLTSKPFLFKPSTGSGSGGSDKGGGGGGGSDGENPWKDGSISRTKQQAIMGTDPAKAKRLIIQAGKPVPTGL